jgi:hypothetical protein
MGQQSINLPVGVRHQQSSQPPDSSFERIRRHVGSVNLRLDQDRDRGDRTALAGLQSRGSLRASLTPFAAVLASPGFPEQRGTFGPAGRQARRAWRPRSPGQSARGGLKGAGRLDEGRRSKIEDFRAHQTAERSEDDVRTAGRPSGRGPQRAARVETAGGFPFSSVLLRTIRSLS